MTSAAESPRRGKRRFLRIGHGPVPFAHTFWLGIWRFDLHLAVWKR